MWVLSLALKVSTEGEHLIENAKLFDSFGAATANVRSPLT